MNTEQLITVSYDKLYNFVGSWVFLIAYCIYLLIIIIIITKKAYDRKVSKEYRKKLKSICKMEHRPISEQVGLIIEMYVDAYTEKNKINWDEILY